MNVIISQILGQPEASHTPEKIFSRGGHVLSRYRTSLQCERSEKLILSSCCFCSKIFGNKYFKIPTCGQLFSTEEVDQIQEEEIAANQPAEFDQQEIDSDAEGELDELFDSSV